MEMLVSVVWTGLKFRVPECWDTEIVQAMVSELCKSVSQNFGTPSPRENKRFPGPQYRVPKCWDTATLYKQAQQPHMAGLSGQ